MDDERFYDERDYEDGIRDYVPEDDEDEDYDEEPSAFRTRWH